MCDLLQMVLNVNVTDGVYVYLLDLDRTKICSIVIRKQNTKMSK